VSLRHLGEFSFIERIAKRVSVRDSVPIGIGDDAAATIPQVGSVSLTSTDMLVEGVHFDLSYVDPWSLGYKSLAVNLSDIAAMGGTPRYFLLSLAIPPALSIPFLDAFMDGMMALAGTYDVPLVGGDTCASKVGLVIAVTVVGEQQLARVVKRKGALVGDSVLVTGALGGSALGLALLQRGEEGDSTKRHLQPAPRVEAGHLLAESGLVNAMIDVSDGLLADLGHILRQSGVGASLRLADIPLPSQFWQQVSKIGLSDPYRLPLAGGEDYELLFTVSPQNRDAIVEILTTIDVPVSVIGEITETGLVVSAPDGTPYPITVTGFDHFAADPEDY
jgi:thiamine-monophosphate kinase